MQRESMGINVGGNIDTYPSELVREKSGSDWPCMDGGRHWAIKMSWGRDESRMDRWTSRYFIRSSGCVIRAVVHRTKITRPNYWVLWFSGHQPVRITAHWVRPEFIKSVNLP